MVRGYPVDRHVGSEFRKIAGADVKNLKTRFKLIIVDAVGMDNIAHKI